VPPAPLRLHGTVQHYDWGDRRFLPDLLGVEPDHRPWAEFWLGTHPSGPTRLDDGSTLRDLIGELPYLLKVVSAAEPLSLQAHPNTEQAVDGHSRGIFPDPHAKPELLCALTPFEALCGLRPDDRTEALLNEIGATELAAAVARRGAGVVLHGLYRGSIDPRPAIEACKGNRRPEADWVTRLDGLYPDEPSVAATLLLNHVTLEPGDALHLTAGNLHAYLRGSGVELMGASDNVLRGGLTRKHVDVDGLLAILDTRPLPQPVMQDTGDGTHYDLPEAGVSLHRLAAGSAHTSAGNEIVMSTDGSAWFRPEGAVYAPTAEAFVVVSA